MRTAPASMATGSIPARAGEPRDPCPNRGAETVYPRACGGTNSTVRRIPSGSGLSPRVRGNLASYPVGLIFEGSIPARAGEPGAGDEGVAHHGVYPRACGGTEATISPSSLMTGLSPRVRGNHRQSPSPQSSAGSIPARAGEPVIGLMTHSLTPVYPRACGGTASTGAAGMVGLGLSPRVRGNLVRPAARMGRSRSIPARAGEPRTYWCAAPVAWVYPRACGGTVTSAPASMPSTGLSPRVRGNHRWNHYALPPPRSIPARAGEPLSRRVPPCQGWVYPRACGGTRPYPAHFHPAEGLSPRVRGNRDGRLPRWRRPRSIPARAGEPLLAASAAPARRVYPRACGGTVWERKSDLPTPGLSPRVRGNHGAVGDGPPAERVYPRACGGTRRTAHRSARCWGLSPRVRGNRTQNFVVDGGVGSIPARAGEPTHSLSTHWLCSVYPRACGGTSATYGKK